MNIQTKRNLKDKVWTLHKDEIKELTITTLITYSTSVDFGPESPVAPGVNTREIYALEDENGTMICQQGEEKCFDSKAAVVQWLSRAEKI